MTVIARAMREDEDEDDKPRPLDEDEDDTQQHTSRKEDNLTDVIAAAKQEFAQLWAKVAVPKEPETSSPTPDNQKRYLKTRGCSIFYCTTDRAMKAGYVQVDVGT